MKVDFFRHALGPGHAAAIAGVLGTPFLTTGVVCRKVEAQLADYFGVPHAVLVNSWTNGALATLLAMGIGPGDEVVVPSMTFIASANVVELTGATTVFADVDPATLLMTPQTLASCLTDRTRVVMPVHLYGQMCDMIGLRDVIDAHPSGEGIRIIEDCAHCFEGERDGEKPGKHSDAAIFSFYATKNVTCGEGGAIVAKDPDLFKAVLEARLHGMSATAVDRFAGGRYNHWDMKRIGIKANLPDILASLLPEQIETIDARLPERRRQCAIYREAFTDGPLRLVAQIQSCKSAEHIFPIGVPKGKRDEAIAALNAKGISVTVNFRSVHRTSYYSKRYPEAAERCPVSEQWGEETLTLPMFPGLTEAEQAYVIEAVRQHIYPLVSSK